MDEEPLSEWAERRDAKIGRLRAVPLTPGGAPGGAHVHPHAPRAIQRWNGHTWEPYALAADLAEAKRLLHPASADTPAPARPPAPNPLATGTGRHRKPPPPKPGDH
jgi:hypothetical protein